MKFTDKLKLLVEVEKKRLAKKGWGNVLAGFTMMITIFTCVYHFGKPIWLEHVPENLHENLEDKKTFFVLGSLAVHVITQVLILCCYAPGYFGVELYKKYEINRNLKWPWEKENGKQVMRAIVTRYILNHTITYPIIMYLLSSTGIRVRFYDFPSFLEFFLQIQFLFFCEDFFFYVFHRATHDSKLLYKIHKYHHQYEKIFIMIRDDFHPIDYFSGVLSFSMGLLFLGSRVHCFTYFFWLFWKIHIGTENHSGYDFPWSPIRVFPFVCGASFHDHHHSVNVGNYGLSTYTWDLMFETGQPYLDDFLERKVDMGDGKKIENKKIENKTPVEAEKFKAN